MAEEDEDAAINYPDWTEYRNKNGLDPLGMQNSSVSLYQTFLPGISNVTLRMRYYGLYAWLCRTYAKEVRDTNPESWKRFIRRAEALYALIACSHGNEPGVAGVEWAQKVLDGSSGEFIDFALAAEPGSETFYLKQAWGAYGAAYRSQLFEIGIFDPSTEHELPIPSLEIGDGLAIVFAESIGDRAVLFFDVIQRGRVSRTELNQLHAVAPSEIGLTDDERALYQDMLLNPADPQDPAATSRRRSLLLILKITGLLARDPKPEEVRWILYAGCDQQARPLDLGLPELDAHRGLWWVYHANDLSHIALETLLKFTLDNIGDYPAGIALARVIPLCAERILQVAGNRPLSWAGLLDSLEPADNAYAADNAESEWSLSAEVTRRAGRTDARVCAPETAWSAIKLLAVLHKRVRDEEHDVAGVLGVFDSEAFRSLLTETRFLDRHLDEDFEQLLCRLLEERVVQRHLWVALQKFRHGDYTFLIEKDEGRVKLREKDGPVFTNPRLGPAITFLRDIYLIGGEGLTEYGAAAVDA